MAKDIVSHPDPATTRLRLPIHASRTEEGLSAALNELLAHTADLPNALGKSEAGEVPAFLVVTFHGDGKWLSERRFFERAARFPNLRASIAKYVDQVNPKMWRSDPFRGNGFWTSIMVPAGALAAVPLALADITHIDTLIRNMRGSDLDHETFHRSLIAKLLKKYGLVEATLRLLAYRAIDGQGQHGEADLHWAMAKGGLRPHIDRDGGLEGFAAQVERISTRKDYRALYASNAGRGLFAGEEARFARWVRWFGTRGLQFDETDRTLGEPRTLDVAKPWKKEWEAAASCKDRD